MIETVLISIMATLTIISVLMLIIEIIEMIKDGDDIRECRLHLFNSLIHTLFCIIVLIGSVLIERVLL